MKDDLRNLIRQSTPDEVSSGAHRETLWRRIEEQYTADRIAPWSPPAYAAALAWVLLLMLFSITAPRESLLVQMLAESRAEYQQVIPSRPVAGTLPAPVQKDRVPYTEKQLQVIRDSVPSRVEGKWMEGF